MRALIVEDDATIADFVAKGLREAGFAVEVASDGEAAFAPGTGDTFDVAIVDVMLPRLDGLGAHRRACGCAAFARRSSSSAPNDPWTIACAVSRLVATTT